MRTAVWGALALIAGAASAADFPQPKEGDHVVKDLKFHTGEVMPELRLHWTTVGDPKGEPVVVLHGTTGMAKFWKGQLHELLQTAPKTAM